MGKQKLDSKQTINQFLIYDIDISADLQMSISEKLSREQALNESHHIFGSFFEGCQLRLTKEKTSNGTRTEEPLENDILSKRDNIYLLRINNNKDVKITKEAGTTTNGIRDYKDFSIRSNPYCYVVIDNRDGHSMLAIQKNSAFGSPNTVKKVLEQNINRLLKWEGYPLKLNLSLRNRPAETWQFCREREERGDSIKQVAFSMPNQKYVGVSQRIQNPEGYIKGLVEFMDLTDAVKTNILVDYEKGSPDKLEEHAHNLAGIIQTCRNKSYHLSIKFRDYGTYMHNDHIKAMFPMKEELLLSFITKWKEVEFEGEFGLINWCDQVLRDSEMYKIC